MEHLALEIFDLTGTGSKYATLPDDTSITITDTSEVFANGDIWSYSFKLNVHANAHVFGSTGEIHGSRMHEQINKRRARLWVEGLPLYLGYLKLDDEVEVDGNGDVDVCFESGQKTFDEMIEGTNAREVSVGSDVIIGLALNRRRVISSYKIGCDYTLDGLAAYAAKYPSLNTILSHTWENDVTNEATLTQYAQRWPKLVLSHGEAWNQSGSKEDIDYTNVQLPYDAAHPFCNINICYQMKANKDGEEVVGRGYTLRLAHGEKTTHGGDKQTRYNNAPNFYLLYFIDRLFKDMGIHITENQAMDVEDLRRVFMLNYGCFYEELEDAYGDDGSTNPHHKTPDDKLSRYGQYYIPFIDQNNECYLTKEGDALSCAYDPDSGNLRSCGGKILLRDVEIDINGEHLLSLGSLEGKTSYVYQHDRTFDYKQSYFPQLHRYELEETNKAYSAYLAYATGSNYPDVEISDIINAMKSMFGIRIIFNSDYSTARIILLRNVFRNDEIQEIECDTIGDDIKQENNKRGFRMTYGKGTEDTSFYYKGFADLFPRKSTTWKDTTDKHDYSQWDLDAEYDEIKQYVSAFNKTCYVTPVTGNAFGIKVDEEEQVLFPSLFGYADFMDAEDGDCSQLKEEGETVEEVQAGASPLIMNDVNNSYASLFSGELKAPTPLDYNISTWSKIATFARLSNNSVPIIKEGVLDGISYKITGKLDLYACESFNIRLEDNYAVSNGGTPFDEASPGLCFGIMRGSGSNSTVRYSDDPQDDENDTWDILPGTNAISHPDICDNYGNEWDYNGQRVISTAADARAALPIMFPESNAVFNDPERGYIIYATLIYIYDNENNRHSMMFAYERSNSPYQILSRDMLYGYAKSLQGLSIANIMATDAAGYKLIVETDSSYGRIVTLLNLCAMAYGGWQGRITIDDGVDSRYGRFSLKLRAEKLNPYYVASLPDVIRTKKEAGEAMKKLYTTSSVDILNRPKVPNATMRAAGWNCPGDGYATVYSMGYGVQCNDGSVHEILWTPIKQSGAVMTEEWLTNYISRFDGVAFSDIKSTDTQKMILDIDTTEQRAEALHGLQAIYYAEDGKTTPPVDISDINSQYLEIDNPNLRRRGLCDQFYSEYSYWVRNARIVKKTVSMELAQLLSIDKTKRVKVGDTIGFIRKMQYSVSNKTGLGTVTMEIMYI